MVLITQVLRTFTALEIFFVSMLPKAVQIKPEIDMVDSTLLYIVSFNVDIHKIVSTLIWDCVMLWRHINLKLTLKQRWNVCWKLPRWFLVHQTYHNNDFTDNLMNIFKEWWLVTKIGTSSVFWEAYFTI